MPGQRAHRTGFRSASGCGVALRRAAQGAAGAIILVAGEAGVGSAAGAGCRGRRGGRGRLGPRRRGRHGALRPDPRRPCGRRTSPQGLAGLGPLGPHLAVLLPAQGSLHPRATGPRFEAICAAFAAMAADTTRLVVLDDLQWSDKSRSSSCRRSPSRSGTSGCWSWPSTAQTACRVAACWPAATSCVANSRLEEHVLGPLDGEFVADILGETPARRWPRLYDRTQGVPFYVEGLAPRRCVPDAIAPGKRQHRAGRRQRFPPARGRHPQRAVLTGARALSPPDAAAVAGDGFDLELVAELSSAAVSADWSTVQPVAEAGPGRGAFRHALTREAFYADVPWLQRRALHPKLAEALEATGAGRSHEVAALGGRARRDARPRRAGARRGRVALRPRLPRRRGGRAPSGSVAG